jgi:hypothetical protein
VHEPQRRLHGRDALVYDAIAAARADEVIE